MSKRSWSPSDIVSSASGARSAGKAPSAPSVPRKPAATARSGTGAWSPRDIKPSHSATKGYGDEPSAAPPPTADKPAATPAMPVPAAPEASPLPAAAVLEASHAVAPAPEASEPTARSPQPAAAHQAAERPALRRPARAGRRQVGEDPLDAHIGQRVRLVRTMRGMSQTDLAKTIGLTFQQVQKYERGSNRISASMLYRLSQALDVPVTFFYDDVPDAIGKPGTGDVLNASASKGTLLTMRALQAIEDDGVRVALDNLVHAMAPRASAVE